MSESAPPLRTPAGARLAEAERSLAEAREALTRAEADHVATLSVVESAREALNEAELAAREARRVARELRREVAKQERKLERMRRSRSPGPEGGLSPAGRAAAGPSPPGS